MAAVARRGLKIGDDELGLPLIHEVPQAGHTLRRPGSGNQILGQCATVANTVVHVSEAETEDLHDVAARAQVAQAAIEGNHADAVTAVLKMGNHLFGAGRVTRTFAVDAVKNVSHELGAVYRGEDALLLRNGCLTERL